MPAVATEVLGRLVGTVVICDGSMDGTCRVAAAKGVDLVNLNRNSGKGSALRAGAGSQTGVIVEGECGDNVGAPWRCALWVVMADC